jgi:predicted AAA+ superfamily ATPase
MIRRRMLAVVRRRLQASPAVALVGARQTGKTTLARTLAGRYFDLQRPADRLRLEFDWDRLAAGRELTILDEAQVSGEVFPWLRSAIDRDRRRRGRFLLLGSVSPWLMRHVSESLAGRLAIVELGPLSLAELPGVPLGRLWARGGYPDGGVLRGGHFPQWQHDYLTVIAERDLPAWGLPARPQVTARLMRMLATSHGQVWNASQIAQSLGVSYHTVNHYVDHLEAAFLIRRLPAYHANIGKRLVKSPKVYWRDSGLLHALLGITEDRLLDHPAVGASWEGFVITQVLSLLAQRDRPVMPYYVRTSDQHELDLVLEVGDRLWAIEVKLTTSPTAADLARLNKVADLIGADWRILITQSPRILASGREIACNLPWLARHLGTLDVRTRAARGPRGATRG